MSESPDHPTATDYQVGIAEILSEADDLAKKDLGLAIRRLEQARSHPEFRPWGALSRLKYLDQRHNEGSRLETAERQACQEEIVSLYEAFPDLEIVWSLLISFFRFNPDYIPMCSRIASSILQSKTIAPWLGPTICECAMNVGAPGAPALMRRAVEAGLLADESVQTAEPLIAYLSAVRSEAGAFPKPIRGWSVRLGGDRLSGTRDGEVVISLSNLGMDPARPDTRLIMESFYFGLYAALDWASFRDDKFRAACETASSADRDAAMFTRFLALLFGYDKRLSEVVSSSNSRLPARGELWVRTGNVELWALRCHLADPERSRDAAEQVALELATTSGANHLRDLMVRDVWWPRTDPVANIARLSMHAGWYAEPGLAGAAFADWAERYNEAICRGHIFQVHSRDLLPVVPLSKGLQGKTLHRFDQEGFVRLLGGETVVFATPFFDKVEANFNAGRVRALWQDAGLGEPMRELTCVSTPMSIWPYRPGRSWSDSFSDLLERSCRKVESQDATVFIASCGGYGLPLVNAIHQKYNISCLYIGHRMNMYFGIVTNEVVVAPENNLYKGSREKGYWIPGDLSDTYPLVGQVEEGRYL